MELIINGVYKHHKGNNYKVLHVARHSESLEYLVIYQALYGDYGIWARPLSMFLEQIEKNGMLVNRFEYVDSRKEAKLSLNLSPEIKKYIYDNDIDITWLLKKQFPKLSINTEPINEGSKDLGLVILCVGASASAVILAINKLVETIIERPKYVEITELTDDGNVLATRTELLQPIKGKHELNVGFEINSQNIKLNFIDKSE